MSGQKEKNQKEIIQVRLQINLYLDILQHNLKQKFNDFEEKESLKICDLLKSYTKKKKKVIKNT